MSAIKDMKQLKEAERTWRGENIQADKVGASVSGYFGYRNLRALWPMSSLDENYNAYDITGQARTLTATDVTSGIYNNKIPYAEYKGTSAYHFRATEAGLQPTTELTMGCWLCINDTSNFFTYMGGGGAYMLLYDNATNKLGFVTTATLGGAFFVYSDAVITTNTWYRVLVRFQGGVAQDIWVNATKNTATPGADIGPIATGFWIGGENNIFSAPIKIAHCFVAMTIGTEIQIRQHYDSIKTAFKVYE